MNLIENTERERTDASRPYQGGKAAIKQTSLIQQPAGSTARLGAGAGSLSSSVTWSHFPLLAPYFSNGFVIIAPKSERHMRTGEMRGREKAGHEQKALA